jgi:hypothetical protein
MKRQICFCKKCLLLLAMLFCVICLVGCINIPIKPYIDKNYNSYKQSYDTSNIRDVKVYKYTNMNAIPPHINETTELIGDASFEASMTPNEQDVIDIKEYAKSVGADVAIFVYSGDKKYAGSYTNYYQYTNSASSTPYYITDGHFYIAFRRTINKQLSTPNNTGY